MTDAVSLFKYMAAELFKYVRITELYAEIDVHQVLVITVLDVADD